MSVLPVWLLLGLVSAGPLDNAPRAAITADRAGRVVTLDYRLLDGNGRPIRNRQPGQKPPEFTVAHNGRQIGSGTFAYG